MKTLKFELVMLPNSIVAVGIPHNQLANYACMLVKRQYLTQNELYILQKMGFAIEVIKEENILTEQPKKFFSQKKAKKLFSK